MGIWIPCVQCSDTRVRRNAVPKVTDSRAGILAGRLFVNITDPFHETFVSSNKFAMLCVDDFARFQMIPSLKCKSDATAALGDIIHKHSTPSNLEIGIIRADRREEFIGRF